ncbi:MAG TPA: NADP-dependent succinic semialdehyde dehydrogenase [Acidimicrobiia bacterium]|jgi:succinate-semialdehyde dehydrogenase/glutarate-semialdehyde dehydrogenase
MAIATTNPTTGEVEKTFEYASADEVERHLALASSTFESYRLTDFATRSQWMNAAADILDDERGAIAALMTTEMGKTVASARAEVQKCADACRFFAENAARFLTDETVDASKIGALDAYVRYEPLGPVLAVMPWNFPLWQVIRFAAPALMAGNVGLLKHASNVPQCALFLEQLFTRAGFPVGAFQTLLVSSDAVEGILRDERVRAATLTGSEPAGHAVASIAGSEGKPTVLELGGSDPFIVLPSADLDRAAEVGVIARTQNNGQSCIAAKRFIVDATIADEFERRFVDRMKALRVGDPFDKTTDVGPIVTEEARERLRELVADAVTKGAQVLCGGTSLPGPGWFYEPTVVAGITPEMRMFHEEVFGPVASLYRVDGVTAAIELANATNFGLGSNAWTDDADERDRCIRELRAGQVFINGMTTSTPLLPFGGVKHSGYGRELSAHGIREFCNVKSVWIGGGDEDVSAGTARSE